MTFNRWNSSISPPSLEVGSNLFVPSEARQAKSSEASSSVRDVSSHLRDMLGDVPTSEPSGFPADASSQSWETRALAATFRERQLSALLDILDRTLQLPVTVVVLSEADVSFLVQSLRGTSPAQMNLVFFGLEARGKLGAKTLVAAHGGTHSLNLVQVGGYPLPAGAGLVLKPGNFGTEITRNENIM